MNNSLTLEDVARRLDPNGSVSAIAELLTQTNEILLDMPFVEGNLQTGHLTTVRTGLPQVAWRELNYGVQPSKSQTAQITDVCGLLEGYGQVDKTLADLNGNTSAFRLSEDRAFLEAMNQEMANALFYGKASQRSKIVGLSTRYSKLAGVGNSKNVISAGGSTNLASMWVVCWGNNTVHGIYPKGSKCGLTHQDLGEVTLTDANNGNYQGYRSHYSWANGLCVRDWRYIVRVCNIDTQALTKDKTAGSDLIDLLDQAVELLPNIGLGKPAIYMNRTLRSYLRRQIKNTANVHLNLEDIAGKKVVTYDGIPVRVCDQLSNDEEVVA